MRFPISPSPMTLLITCLVLSLNPILGQSLSIKRVDGKYWIEANAPAGSPHNLQASDNLHLWVDIQEDVQAPYSFALDEGGVSERYFRFMPTPEPAPPIRILLVGDSLSSDCCGWGGGLYGYFKPNATVVNYAQPWTSTKVFLQSAEVEKMLLIKPDYVLIQFGWFDGGSDPDRATTPQEFADNLRFLVQTVRGFNGIPILLTVHAARTWDPQGKLTSSPHPRNAVTRQVATEMNTPFIDLYQITAGLFSELGPDGCAFMHWDQGGPEDVMHLSPPGGVYVSRFLTHFLPDDLGPYLTGIFNPPPKP